MEGLLFLLALVPIALLILLIITIAKLGGLREELRVMRLQMGELMKSLAEQRRTVPGHTYTAEKEAERPPIITPPPRPAPPPSAPPPVVKEVPVEIPVPPPPPVPISRPVEVSSEQHVTFEARKAVASAMSGPPPVVVAPPRVPPPPPPPPRPSFLERNPDLEKFIGENLINKIGIAVLVVGLGLLLKYAIGKGYISETGRTLIGLGSGALLIFFAHRLRARFRAFSSVLVGGGLCVLYFSIYIAFQDYEIIAQTPAFLVMIGITAIGVLLTLVYDRRELAVIALLGGFAAPFLTSRGEGNYIVLFSYLLILNTGMLVLSNYKKWHLINVISFVLTSIIFGGWLGMRFIDMEPRPIWPAFGFTTGFFLVFFTMNLRYNLKHGSTFVPLDFSLLLANTAVYFAGGLSVLQGLKPSLDGVFTIALAAFHLVFAWLFYKRVSVPRHLVYLLIGLVLTFLSLAGPIQLEGNNITLFWSAELVLLLWFSQRTGIRLVERASVLVLVLMVISLLMDLNAYYTADPLVRLRPLMNQAWITGTVAAIALFVYGKLCEKLPGDRPVLPGLSPAFLRTGALVLCAAVLYLGNFLEIGHQLGYLYEGNVVKMALTAYSLAALVVLHLIARGAGAIIRTVVFLLFIVGLLYYITEFYSGSLQALLDQRVFEGGRGFAIFHYAAFAAAVAAIVSVALAVRKLIPRPSSGWSLYLWGICIYLVFFASQELDHAILAFIGPKEYEPDMAAWVESMGPRWTLMEALTSMRKGAYPILWGVGSFMLMWYGMRTRQRMVRIIALSLFGFTLLKLFLYDIRGVSEGGKVAAFICLGALLLVVSFMYNKLKGLLLEGDQPVSPPPPPLP